MHQENQQLLQADPDTDIWRAYVDYIDEIVVDRFFNTIQCSLRFLLTNTEPNPGIEPLFEATLELQVLSAL